MISILLIGLGLIVLGLNLKMIWYMLTRTRASTKRVEVKIKEKGIGVAIVGVLVIIAGCISYKFSWLTPFESGAIIMTGSEVAILGLAWVLEVCGRGHESCVRDGARFVTGVGAGLILIYVVYKIVVCVIPLFCL